MTIKEIIKQESEHQNKEDITQKQRDDYPLSAFEWVTRAQLHFANRTKDYSHIWTDYAETLYAEYLDHYPRNPEECVDMDISYWD